MSIIASRKETVYTLPVFLAWNQDSTLVWTRKDIRGVHKDDILNELRMYIDSMTGYLEAETHRIVVIDFELWLEELELHLIDPIPEDQERPAWKADHEEFMKTWGDYTFGRRERVVNACMNLNRELDSVDAYYHEAVLELLYISEHPNDARTPADAAFGDNYWAISDLGEHCVSADFPDTDYLRTAIMSDRPSRGTPQDYKFSGQAEELYRKLMMQKARRLAYYAAREAFCEAIGDDLERYTFRHQVDSFLALNASEIFNADYTSAREMS